MEWVGKILIFHITTTTLTKQEKNKNNLRTVQYYRHFTPVEVNYSLEKPVSNRLSFTSLTISLGMRKLCIEWHKLYWLIRSFLLNSSDIYGEVLLWCSRERDNAKRPLTFFTSFSHPKVANESLVTIVTWTSNEFRLSILKF